MLTPHQKMIKALNEKSGFNPEERAQSCPTITVTTEWISQSAWDSQCKVTLRNLTNKNIDYLKVECSLLKGTPYQHSGFSFSRNGTHLTGYLEEWKLPLRPHGQTDFILGVSYSDGTGLLGSMPEDFVIDDQHVAPGEDTTPPSVPEDLSLVEIYPYSASLAWSPSTDQSGIKGYYVYYHQTKNELNAFRISISDPFFTLSNLLPDEEYEVRVSAEDMAGNESEKSAPLYLHTLEEVPGPIPPIDPDLAFLSLPFVDGTAYPTPEMSTLVDQAGTTGSFVGFVVGRDQKPCWGGHLTIYDSNTGIEEDGDARISNYHKKFFKDYPQAMLSIGGAAGLPPSSDASLSSEDLCKMYADIIENYGLSGLDFDFEGGFLGDTAALNRHLQAIVLLLSQKPDLKITYTLPVDGSPGLQGFSYYGEILLRKIAEHGIRPFAIQCMLMEFGQGSSHNLFEASKIALEGAHRFLWSLFGKLSMAQVFSLPQIKKLLTSPLALNVLHREGYLHHFINGKKLSEKALEGFSKGTLPNLYGAEPSSLLEKNINAETLYTLCTQTPLLENFSTQDWQDIVGQTPVDPSDLLDFIHHSKALNSLHHTTLNDVLSENQCINFWGHKDQSFFNALAKDKLLSPFIHVEKLWSHLLSLSIHPEKEIFFSEYPLLNDIISGQLDDHAIAKLFSLEKIDEILGCPTLLSKDRSFKTSSVQGKKNLFHQVILNLVKDVEVSDEAWKKLFTRHANLLKDKNVLSDKLLNDVALMPYHVDQNLVNALKNNGFSDGQMACLLSNHQIFQTHYADLSESAWTVHLKNLLKNSKTRPHKGWTSEETWKHLAACPMFGRNNNGKVFTVQNQRDLNAYCKAKGMPIMSGWDMTRDTRMSPEQIGIPDHQHFDFCHEVANYSAEREATLPVNQNKKTSPGRKKRAS